MTQAFNLAQLANKVNSSGQLDVTSGLVNIIPTANLPTVPVSKGGTGLTSAGSAGNILQSNGTGFVSVAFSSLIGNPAFSAYPTTDQYTQNDTWAKLTFAGEEFDTNNCYSTSTARFTPNVAGYYSFNATIKINANSALQLAIYKNGSQFKVGQYFQPSIAFGTTLQTLMYMNGTTDYVELWVYANGVNQLVTSATDCYFQGNFVRPA